MWKGRIPFVQRQKAVHIKNYIKSHLEMGTPDRPLIHEGATISLIQRQLETLRTISSKLEKFVKDTASKTFSLLELLPALVSRNDAGNWMIWWNSFARVVTLLLSTTKTFHCLIYMIKYIINEPGSKILSKNYLEALNSGGIWCIVITSVEHNSSLGITGITQ